MSIRASKRIISVVVGIVLITSACWSFGQNPASELVVQYDQPLVVGNGGPIAGLTILIPEMVNLFSTYGVVDIELVFDDFLTEKTINGHIVEMPSFANYYKIQCPDEFNAKALKDQLDLEPSVIIAGSNALYFEALTCDLPDDPFYSDQWYLSGHEHSIGVDLAWEIACGSGNQTTNIAIFDWPVGNISNGSPEELTCIGSSPLPNATHGTSVFAIIAAEPNLFGITGIGRDLVKYTYDAIDEYDLVSFGEDLRKAVDDDGCQIICTSLGLLSGPEYSSLREFRGDILTELLYVIKSGVLFVAAGGQVGDENDLGRNHLAYPAGFGRSVMGVGSYEVNGAYSPWADHGPMLDVVAPGRNILTYHGPIPQMDYRDGTSEAQPIVTGIACLMHKVRPDLVAEDYEHIIKAFCKDDSETTGFDVNYGWGRLDGGRAVANLVGAYEVEKGHWGSVGVVNSVTQMQTRFIGFSENWLSRALYNVDMVEIRHDISWQTTYLDSVFAWGNVAGTVGFEPVTNYYHEEANGDIIPRPVVTPLEYCEPDRSTMTINGAEFVTYGYIVYETEARINEIGRLGPTNAGEASFAYGVIGKTHDPYPVTYVPPADPVGDTGLDYFGTPYSVVEWDFLGTGAETKDLFISIGDDFSQFYQGTGVSSAGIPEFETTPISDFNGGVPNSGLRGLAVADMGNDGLNELFAAHETEPRLYRYNQVTQKFDNVAVSLGIETKANKSIAGTWGDFDGDGFLDLFVSRAPNFVEIPLQYSEPGLATNGSVLLTNASGSGPEGREFLFTPTSGLPENLGSISASWNDFDGDGDMDLFVGSLYNTASGASRLYSYVDSVGSFTDVTNTLQSTPITMVTACAWADMNGDETLDLVLTRDDQSAAIYFNDGVGNFSDGNSGPGPFLLGTSDGFSGLVIYDFDLDSDLDFLALSNSDQRSPVLFNNQTVQGGPPQFQGITNTVGLGDQGYVHGALATDFGNAAGEKAYPDLYLGRPTSSGKFYFKGEPTGNSSGLTNHFVKIRLESNSATDNSLGIGAKVKLTSGTNTQIRLVDGGSMRGSQSSSELLFGLGDYQGSITATVTWPSGIVQSDVPLVIDQLNVIKLDAIQVDDPTVVGKYIIQASGLVDWEFKWDVNILGDAQFNEVIFDMASLPTQCQPEEASITLSTSSNVDLSVSANASGGFTNVLTWRDRPCVPACNIPFKVKSGNNLQTDTSDSYKILSVRICIGN